MLLKLLILAALLVSMLGLDWVKDKFGDKKAKEFAKTILSNLNFRYNNYVTTFLIPFLLIAVYWAFIFYKIGYFGKPFPITLEVILAAIIIPIEEEIVHRGILLNGIILALDKIYNTWKLDSTPLVLTTSLMLSAFVFSLMHGNGIDFRFILGLITGFAYLLDSKNLMPAFIIHSLNNLLVTSINS